MDGEWRVCLYCDCKTNAKLRRCCNKGYEADISQVGGTRTSKEVLMKKECPCNKCEAGPKGDCCGPCEDYNHWLSNGGLSGGTDQEAAAISMGYRFKDDIWPSRRWNKERTDYIDLSGPTSRQ